ncbi:MAG TPA: MFS transporter, partial [Bacteroidales bacterium]|nr:MFS transporter [Bacteroidales bacterium]
MQIFKFFEPPKAKPLLPEEKIASEYKRMRLKVFLGAFLGYAAYYLVRKNLALAIPGMIKPLEEGGLGYTKLELGIALSAIGIAYAFSKFIMGALSDRSDARKFLVVGLILSSALMMSVGLFSFAT